MIDDFSSHAVFCSASTSLLWLTGYMVSGTLCLGNTDRQAVALGLYSVIHGHAYLGLPELMSKRQSDGRRLRSRRSYIL